MTELDEIKAKYPLAVEALKGKAFNAKIEGAFTEIRSNDFTLHVDVYEAQSEGLGELLAELLNLIAKP